MKLMVALTLTIASADAFFSLVCPQVLPHHARIMELTAYVPIVKTHMAKYRAPTLSVAQPRTKPNIAIIFATVMCHVLSLKWPDDRAHKMEIPPATR